MSQDKPIVSVITPAYRCASVIGETIESVQAQTLHEWEMIIVNDCSPDNTGEVVRTYASKDNRIHVLDLETNCGSAAARNTAIRYASGRYIALLDSDDIWKPEKLKRQLNFMMERGYAFTFTAYEVFHTMADTRRKVFEVPSAIDYRHYLKNSIIGCLTVMVDREQIADFHMESGYLEDVLTWMHYLGLGWTAYGLNENLASYRVAVSSKSGNKFRNAQRYYACLKEQPDLSRLYRMYCQLGYMYHAAKKRIFGKTAVYGNRNSDQDALSFYRK